MNKITLLALVFMLFSCEKEVQQKPHSLNAVYSTASVSDFKALILPSGDTVKYSCDSAYFVEKQAPVSATPTVLIGSSSSTTYFWPSFLSVFDEYNPIQKGVGGNTWGHIYNRIPTDVTAFKPKQIVMWCGENDIYARTRGVDFDENDYMWTFKRTFNRARSENKTAKITVIEMKRPPLLQAHWTVIDKSNALAKAYVLAQSNTSWVTINDLLTSKDYRSDGMHLVSAANSKTESRLEPHLIP